MSRDLQPKYHLRTNFKQKNGIKHREMKKEREREREREREKKMVEMLYFSTL